MTSRRAVCEGAGPSGGAIGGAPNGASSGARSAPASEGAGPSERRTGEAVGVLDESR